MSNSVVLKHPAEFFTLGPRQLGIRPQTHRWCQPRRHRLTECLVTWCLEWISEPAYTRLFRKRFTEGTAEAIAFVANRTHPEFPLQVCLSRFTNEGERCVNLTVDGHPLPGFPIDLPSPTDPDLRRYNINHHFAHARILAETDGYMICWDDHILQLDLSWCEQPKIQL